MRALVTGATSGIGEAITKDLLTGGHEVLAVGRRTQRLAALKAQENTERLSISELDVTDRAAVCRVISSAGDLDVVVNNAGGALGLSPGQEAEWSDWEGMIAANVTGLTSITHAVLPSMVARGQGIIVNIGSIAGQFPYPGGNVYGATKAFVRQFTLNLRADLMGTGVRVTDIEPGLVGGTEFSQVRFHGDEERARSVYEGMNPLTPGDISSLVMFILSLPSHVCIPTMTVMPTDQGFAPLPSARRT
jgi:3-hydroxy acid dehydrogenase/malonic semialdehyde reductase